MNQNIKFEKCTIADLDAVRDISEETFTKAFSNKNSIEDMREYVNKAFSKEQIRRELSDTNSIFYFVKKFGHIIGYIKVNVEDAQNEPIKEGLELERIYIKSAFQGQGLGKQMITKVFEIAKGLNKSTIWLGVWNKNFGAIRFYENFGFKKFSEHSFLLGSDQQVDDLMELKMENLEF